MCTVMFYKYPRARFIVDGNLAHFDLPLAVFAGKRLLKLVSRAVFLSHIRVDQPSP